jgi:hypothetical protein
MVFGLYKEELRYLYIASGITSTVTCRRVRGVEKVAIMGQKRRVTGLVEKLGKRSNSSTNERKGVFDVELNERVEEEQNLM